MIRKIQIFLIKRFSVLFFINKLSTLLASLSCFCSVIYCFQFSVSEFDVVFVVFKVLSYCLVLQFPPLCLSHVSHLCAYCLPCQSNVCNMLCVHCLQMCLSPDAPFACTRYFYTFLCMPRFKFFIFLHFFLCSWHI